MNICLATTEFPPVTSGGISTYYSTLARLLTDAGHKVTVLTISASETAASWAYPGVTVVRLQRTVESRMRQLKQALPVRLYPVAMPIAAGLAMRDWLLTHSERYGIEVVEVHEYGGECAFLMDDNLPPLLVTCHGSTSQVMMHERGVLSEHKALQAALEYSAVTGADEIACHSQQNLSGWRAYTGRSPLFVTAPFKTVEAGNAKALSSGQSLHGVCVGRLQNWKGVIELMDALKMCSAEGLRQVQVEWIGADTPTAPSGISMRVYLEKYYSEIWGKSFRWIDRLNPIEVRQRQEQADFAIVPSHWDTFNYSAIEAMSVGTPLIISTTVGASYLVRDGKDALLVPPQDSKALAAAIRTLAADASLRSTIGKAGQETIRREFAPEKVVQEHMTAYASAVERHSYRRRHPYGVPAAHELVKNIMQISVVVSANREALPTRRLSRALTRKGKQLVVSYAPQPATRFIKARLQKGRG